MMDFPLGFREPSFFSKNTLPNLQLGGSYRDRACNRRFGSGLDSQVTLFRCYVPGDGGDVIVDGLEIPQAPLEQ